MVRLSRYSGVTVLESELSIAADMDTVWKFFSSPANLSEITPPAMDFRITGTDITTESYAGQIITYTLRPFRWLRVNWVTEITHLEKGSFFTDEQRFGPYRFWHHRHYFKADGRNTIMKDIVTFKVPGGIIGRLIGRLTIEQRVKEIFVFRAAAIKQIFNKTN